MHLLDPNTAVMLDNPFHTQQETENILTIPITTFSIKCGGMTGKAHFMTNLNDVREERPSFKTRPGLCPLSGRMLLQRGGFRDQAEFRLAMFI